MCKAHTMQPATIRSYPWALCLLLASLCSQAQGQTRCSDDWQQALDVMNAARSARGAPDLWWNKKLADNAQYWCETLADKNCNLRHSGPGENLYANYGYKARGNCVDAVKMWLAEESDYRYIPKPQSGNNFMKTGHFTQVVWKSTSQVGCGSATNGKCVVVCCQYLAWGNLMSDSAYLENVLPVKKSYQGARTFENTPQAPSKRRRPPPPKRKRKSTGRKLQ